MTKYRKLVTGATDLEIRMQKYYGETRDDGYAMVPLHVSTNDHNSDGVRKSSRSTQNQGQGWQQGLFMAI